MPDTPRSGRRVAVAMLSLACMAWGLSFVLIKDADGLLSDAVGLPPGLASAWIVAARFLIAFALLAAWPSVLSRLFRGPVLRDGFILAVPSVLGYTLQAAGMRGLEPGANAFLTSLYTPFTPLLAFLLFRRPPAARVLAAVPVALVGVAVLTGVGRHGDFSLLARFGASEALVVTGSVCWAMQILLIDRLARRHPALPFSASLFLWTGLLALAAFSVQGGFSRPLDALRPFLISGLRVPLAGLVLLSTILTLVLLVRYQPRLDPSRAALLYLLEPAFAAVFAVALAGESFGGAKLAGCLLLLSANVLVEVRWPVRGPRGGPPRS